MLSDVNGRAIVRNIVVIYLTSSATQRLIISSRDFSGGEICLGNFQRLIIRLGFSGETESYSGEFVRGECSKGSNVREKIVWGETHSLCCSFTSDWHFV